MCTFVNFQSLISSPKYFTSIISPKLPPLNFFYFFLWDRPCSDDLSCMSLYSSWMTRHLQKLWKSSSKTTRNGASILVARVVFGKWIHLLLHKLIFYTLLFVCIFTFFCLILLVFRLLIPLLSPFAGCRQSNKKCSKGSCYTWAYIFLSGGRLQIYDLCQNASVISTIMYDYFFPLFYSEISNPFCQLWRSRVTFGSLPAYCN